MDHLISSVFLGSRYYCCFHFAGEGIEAWRGYTTGPGTFGEAGI